MDGGWGISDIRGILILISNLCSPSKDQKNSRMTNYPTYKNAKKKETKGEELESYLIQGRLFNYRHSLNWQRWQRRLCRLLGIRIV